MKKPFKALTITVLGFSVLVFVGGANATGETHNPVLSLENAQVIANEAQRKCSADGYAVTVAVVDRHGNLLVQLRNPQAGPHTVGSSFGKAFTSASMGQPTERLADAIAGNPKLAGMRDMDPRLVILAGGLPISIDGYRVGGVGVGGTPDGHIDAVCAEAGIKALSK